MRVQLVELVKPGLVLAPVTSVRALLRQRSAMLIVRPATDALTQAEIVTDSPVVTGTSGVVEPSQSWVEAEPVTVMFVRTLPVDSEPVRVSAASRTVEALPVLVDQ